MENNNREFYQKMVFLIDEHRWHGTPVGMEPIAPRLTVTGKTRRIVFITGSDFID